MADQMPFDSFATKFGDLALCLLNPVLAKGGRAGCYRFANKVKWVGLTDRDQFDLARIAIDPTGRGCDLSTNEIEVSGKF